MSDRICTNCGGATATGCWMCNPELNTPMPSVCDCAAKDRRIAELEQDVKVAKELVIFWYDKATEYKKALNVWKAN